MNRQWLCALRVQLAHAGIGVGSGAGQARMVDQMSIEQRRVAALSCRHRLEQFFAAAADRTRRPAGSITRESCRQCAMLSQATYSIAGGAITGLSGAVGFHGYRFACIHYIAVLCHGRDTRALFDLTHQPFNVM